MLPYVVCMIVLAVTSKKSKAPKAEGIPNKEIDFIAQKGTEKEYYQVCYLLASDETVEREFGVYSSVKDNYPKYVLSLDDFDFSQNGIIHKNVIKWLLGV